MIHRFFGLFCATALFSMGGILCGISFADRGVDSERQVCESPITERQTGFQYEPNADYAQYRGAVTTDDGLPPVVFWVSSPVKANETVLIHGANFAAKSESKSESKTVSVSVELKQGEKKQSVVPLNVTDTSMAFVLPADFSDAQTTRGIVRANDSASAEFTINAPAFWWIQGDQGRNASTKNGRIWITGNCLAVPKEQNRKPESRQPAPAKTRSASAADFSEDQEPVEVRISGLAMDSPYFGKPKSLEIRRQDAFCIEAALPDDLPAGRYNIGYRRSPAEPEQEVVGQISVVPTVPLYKPETFDITKFGAIPNDGRDDTDAILSALEKLTANGGGTLFIPRGRFQVNKMIELPPLSRLTGLGDSSQLYWSDVFEPVDALVKGTHSFEVSNLFLTCGNHKDGIVGNGPLPQTSLSDDEKANYRSGNVTVRNVTLRLLYSQYINDNPAEMVRRLKPLHYVRALRFGGENIIVENNDIYCCAGGVFELRLYWSRVQNNRFCRGNIVGWNGFCGQQLLFTDNWLGGANCTSFYGLPEGSENILWTRNYHENNFDGNNRETITGDGRVHGYMDTVENITKYSFTLQKDVSLARGLDLWQTGLVQIAGGKGVGQIRRIKSLETDPENQRTVRCRLESPWEIVPDEQSVLNISSFRRRFIYAQNEANDSTVALQLYGSMIEGIIANNKTARTGGYNADAMSGEANWYNQLLENEIVTGNSFRGPRNEVPALNAQIGLLAYGNGTGNYKYPLVRACVVRNNLLNDNARLNVQGTVVESLLEGNQINQTETGISVDPSAQNIVLRGNRFQDVEKPYNCPETSVCIDPVERFNDQLASVIVLLKKSGRKIPKDWPVHGAKTPQQIESIRIQALRALTADAETNSDAAASSRQTVSAEIAQTLTGLTIQFPNWATTYWTLRDGKEGTCWLLTRPYYCALPAHLKLSIPEEWFPLASEANGWKFEFAEYDLEPGKTPVDINAKITKPAGVTRLLRFPLRAELTGADSDGKPWSLTFEQTISDPYDSIPISGFRVSKPLDNPLNRTQGVSQKLGYIPYNLIPQPQPEELVDAPTEFGRFAFASLFAPQEQADPQTKQPTESKPTNSDGQLIYGTSTLKVSESTKIQVRFDSNFLLYVNGEVAGTTLSHGQWGFVQLNAGENRIEFLSLPLPRGEFRVSIPTILWAERPEALFQ